jgi:hypothetical protein
VTIRRLPLLAGVSLAAAALAAACAGTQIGSPDDYKKVALNRVYPYPTAEELARQKTEVVLASHYGTELPASVVGPAMTSVQQELLRVLNEAGTRVVDRSLDNLARVRRDMTAEYKRRRRGAEADWALITRITRYSHFAHYQSPSSLFKSKEELAADPGECTHSAEVQVDIKAIVVPKDEIARTTFTLENSASFEQSEFDESCPITEARKEALLEEVLAEALLCLVVPMKNQFAPRGYLAEHRVSTAGDTHIYKTSLGSENGARPGIELWVFRVQYMTTNEGRQERAERRIGRAVITDEIGPHHSWILVEPGDFEQPPLAGDMVRAVFKVPLTDNLGFGSCNDHLKIESAPL